MMKFMKLWRAFTIIGLVIWVLFTAILIPELLEAHRDGWYDSNAPMMVSFHEGGSAITYAEWYDVLVQVTLIMLFFILVCVVSLIYQHRVLRAGSLLPDGKWLLPVLTVLLHIGVVFLWFRGI